MTADQLSAPLEGWHPPLAPPRQPISGRWAALEPLSYAHVGPLFLANSADVEGGIWRYLPYGPFETEEAYADWVAGASRGADPQFFAILMEDGRPSGVASYLRIAPQAGSIEIGHICLSPRLQRTPAATEALSLMIGWAFALGYRRVEWKCDAENAASRRAAARLGFRFEGVFAQAGVVKGRNRDTAWYALLDRDWPAVSAAHAAWLSPENFDAEGAQRSRLSDLTAPLLAPAPGAPGPLARRPEVLAFLAARRSRPAKTLSGEAPDAAGLAEILQIATRVPDHGKLAPWRVLVLGPETRARAAESARRLAHARGAPDGGEKAAAQFGQGGAVLAVVSSPKPSEKIPRWEQEASAAAVCQQALTAALAAGWGANWLTGPHARDPEFLGPALGLAEGETVAGFIHIGGESVVPAERDRPSLDAAVGWLA